MRFLCMAILLPCACAYGCGSTRSGAGATSPKAPPTTATTVAAGVTPGRDPAAEDGDDNFEGGDDPGRPRDRDDRPPLAGGALATAVERAEIVALVRRYYAAGAARDGGVVCSLLYSTTAEGLPLDYGRPPGPPQLRGSTCAAVMSKLLALRHAEFAAKRARLVIASVSVKGADAAVLMRFRGMSERILRLRSERGRWTVSELTDLMARP